MRRETRRAGRTPREPVWRRVGDCPRACGSRRRPPVPAWVDREPTRVTRRDQTSTFRPLGTLREKSDRPVDRMLARADDAGQSRLRGWTRGPKNRDARRREEVPAGARYTDPSREEKLVRSAGRREGGVAIRPDGMALGKAQIRVTPTRTISGGEPVRTRTRGASVTSITAWKIGQFLCPNKPFVRMSIMHKCMARN